MTTKRKKKQSTESCGSWRDADDPELLRMRICDLDVSIEGSVLEQRVANLHAELDAKGLRSHPTCYLTTEWLCPDRVPLVGIPFCLADPRLERLEQTMMLEVEGGTEKECMKLLRHEAGHAVNYAYRLYRRTRWRELFGPMSTDYSPHEYYLRPYSKQYVIHLEDNYAQAHPDEDFAETFAVWLTPGLDWREKYRGWGALKKLEYVDHLMQEVGDQPPRVTGGPRLWPAGKVRSTLESYYKRKRKEFATGYPGFYDPILLELFTEKQQDGCEAATRFLSHNRRTLTATIAQWARVRKYAADHLIRRLARRSKEMGLYLRTDEAEALFRVGVCLTALVLEARERYLEDKTREQQ